MSVVRFSADSKMQYRCLVLVWLTLLLGRSYAQPVPIQLVLSANEVTAGDQFSASCNTSSQAASVDLEINGFPIMDIASGRFMSTSQGTITTWTINSVQREDAGTYVCVAAANDPDDADSLPQDLIVNFAPMVTIPMPLTTVSVDQSVTVVISFEAMPSSISISVARPNERAQMPNELITANNATLKFSPVNRYNNGTYTVNVTNSIGTGVVDFQLIVYFGPIFSYDGQEQIDGASIPITTFETNNFIITCNVIATNPVVTSLNLTSRPPADNVNFNAGTGVITITEVTVENEGTYTCTGNNGETTPTTINFVLTVDEITISSPTTNSAENMLATVTLTVIMLLATILLF